MLIGCDDRECAGHDNISVFDGWGVCVLDSGLCAATVVNSVFS